MYLGTAPVILSRMRRLSAVRPVAPEVPSWNFLRPFRACAELRCFDVAGLLCELDDQRFTFLAAPDFNFPALTILNNMIQ